MKSNKIIIEEDCMECHGRGYQNRHIPIKRICKLCGGSGKTDWVSNINKRCKTIDSKQQEQILKETINNLIHELQIEIFEQTNCKAEISIKIIRDDFDFHMMPQDLMLRENYEKKKTKTTI